MKGSILEEIISTKYKESLMLDEEPFYMHRISSIQKGKYVLSSHRKSLYFHLKNAKDKDLKELYKNYVRYAERTNSLEPNDDNALNELLSTYIYQHDISEGKSENEKKLINIIKRIEKRKNFIMKSPLTKINVIRVEKPQVERIDSIILSDDDEDDTKIKLVARKKIKEVNKSLDTARSNYIIKSQTTKDETIYSYIPNKRIREVPEDLPEIIDHITKAKYLSEDSMYKAYQAAYLENKNLVVIANKWKVRENIAILAILNALTHSKKKILYLNQIPALITRFYNRLQPILAFIGFKVTIYSSDMSNADVILATPKNIKDIPTHTSLIIADDLETLEDYDGSFIEPIIIKAKIMSGIRLIGLSVYVPNYNDLAAFFNATAYVIDSAELEFTFYGKEVFRVQDLCGCILDDFNKQFIIFRPSAGDVLDCISPLLEIMKAKGIQEEIQLEHIFFKCHNEEIRKALKYGIGILCDSMEYVIKELLMEAFNLGKLRMLVAEIKCAWNIIHNPNASIIIGGITYFNYYARRALPFSEPELHKAIACGNTRQIIVPSEDLLLATSIIAHHRYIKSTFPLQSFLNKEMGGNFISTKADIEQFIDNSFNFKSNNIENIDCVLLESNLRKIARDFSLDEQTVAYLSYYIQIERNSLKLLPLATVLLKVKVGI